MEVNWSTPKPTADVNAGRYRPGLESDLNANIPSVGLNSRASHPRAKIDADANRPRIERSPGVSRRKPPDVQMNNDRYPRADVDSSRNPPHGGESELRLQRPHGQATVDPIDFHDLSDNELPFVNEGRPGLPQWKSAEEVDRAKPMKLVDRSDIDYEKIYPRDEDLSNCRYVLTPQNNLWVKTKTERKGSLGQPRGGVRHTNWTEKMRNYLGASNNSRVHQYNTAYAYDKSVSPYRLTYLNSTGFSHAIDRPRGNAAARPQSNNSVRVYNPAKARIRSNGRRKRRPKTTCCGDDDVDTIEPQPHVAYSPVPPRAAVVVEPNFTMHRQSPELYADVPWHSSTYHLDTPRATTHVPTPVESRHDVFDPSTRRRPVDAVDSPNCCGPMTKVPISNWGIVFPKEDVDVPNTRPFEVQEPRGPHQSPALHADVPTPHFQATASPRKRRTRNRGCCACGSDSDDDSYTVEPPRSYVRVDTPPLISDTRLDLHDPSPRTYEVQAKSPRLAPAVKLDTPTYSMKPPSPSVHLKANPPRRLPAVNHQITSPTVEVSAPKPVAKPTLKVVKPSVHVVKPKPTYRVPTPKLNLRAPKLKPINVRKPNIQLKTPDFRVPKPKVPISNLGVAATRPTLNAGIRKTALPKAQVRGPRIKVREPEIPKADVYAEAPKVQADVGIDATKPKIQRDVDISPPKPKVKADVDISPPKPKVKADVDISPPMPKAKADVDISPPKPKVKSDVDISPPKPKVQKEIGIGSPQRKPYEIPPINLRGPEKGKRKKRTPRLAPKVEAYTPKPMANPTFADLQINAPRPIPVHIPPARANTPEVYEPELITPRAVFNADVPKPTVKPLKTEIRAPSPVSPRAEFHADVPKPTVKPLKTEIRSPSPLAPKTEFHADIPKPILKPLKVYDSDVSVPRPEIRAPMSRGSLPSPEVQAESKPPTVPLPPVSATYYPPPQVPPPVRAPPISVTLPKLPKLPKPPMAAARVDLSRPEAPARKKPHPRNEKPPPTTSKLYQPPKTEPLKWRLRPDEPKKGDLQSTPPASPTMGHLTYYPPSNVATSPRLRAGLY